MLAAKYRLRAERRAAGLCVECGATAACACRMIRRARERARGAGRRAAGLCTKCGGAAPGRSRCPSCWRDEKK